MRGLTRLTCPCMRGEIYIYIHVYVYMCVCAERDTVGGITKIEREKLAGHL